MNDMISFSTVETVNNVGGIGFVVIPIMSSIFFLYITKNYHFRCQLSYGIFTISLFSLPLSRILRLLDTW